MFHDKYEITEEELEENGFLYAPYTDRVIMPSYNSLGYQTGRVARSYADSIRGAKAISYFDNGKHQLHYVPNYNSERKVIVGVEDIPSAIRVARQARTVALLGSHLSQEHIDDLASQTRHFILALDPDATNKAIKLKKMYSLYFNRFDVRVLSADPKDVSDEQITEEILT